MNRFLLGFLFLFLPLSFIYSQHTVELSNGVDLQVEVYGVESSSLNESGNTITYTRKHQYASVSVVVHYDFSRFHASDICETGEYNAIFAQSASISNNSVLAFNPDGSPDSTVLMQQVRKNLSPDYQHAVLSLGSNGASNVTFNIGTFTFGICASLLDSVATGQTGGMAGVIVKPVLDMGMIAEAQDDLTDGELKKLTSGFHPPIPIKPLVKPQPWPVEDSYLTEQDETPSCDFYGRPKYAVNMQTLDLKVQDIEYIQGGRGPSLIFSRHYEVSNREGFFGPGWVSSLEGSLYLPALYGRPLSTNFLHLGGERERTFSYDTIQKVFYSHERLDSLLKQDTSLVYYDGYTQYKYVFDSLPQISADSMSWFLTRVEDPFQNTIQYYYNEYGKPDSITDAAGRTVKLSYDAEQRLTSFLLPDGRETTYTYDEDGFLFTATDLAGQETVYQYDTVQNIRSFDFEGQLTTFTYQFVGFRPFVQTVTNPAGEETTYNLILWTNIASGNVVDPLGHYTRYNHDSYGRLTSISDHEWNAVRFDYDEKHRMISRELEGGEMAEYTWDEEDRITEILLEGYADYQLEYDSVDHLIRRTDPFDQVQEFLYTDQNRVWGFVNPLNDTTFLDYNEYGELSRLELPSGRYYTYTYDAFGNLDQVQDNLGLLLDLDYDAQGYFPERITDGSDRQTTFSFDENARLASYTTPGNQTYQLSYGCCGLSEMSDPAGRTTTFQRDELNALTAMDLPGGHTVEVEYDEAHRITSVTDNKGNAYLIRYDSRNMPVSLKKPSGDSIGYTFNENGYLTAVTDERKNVYQFDYSYGKVYSMTDPAGRRFHTVRDKLGRVMYRNNNFNSNQISYNYTHANQVSKKTMGSTVYDYTYNKSNALTEVSGNDLKTVYTRDIRDRITEIEYDETHTIGYTYSLGDRMESITYPDGYEVEYVYDALNRVRKITLGSDTVAFVYDDDGNLIEEQRSNDSKTVYSWANGNRLTDISHLFGGTEEMGIGYHYDLNANVYQMDVRHPSGIDFSGSTEVDQLVYNNLNQLTSDGSNTYTYDEAGNLLSVSGAASNTFTYTWEQLPESISTATGTIQYKYNGLQQIQARTAGTETTTLLYDAYGKLLAEVDEAGTVLVKYIYSGNRLTARIDAGGSLYFYHFDKTGSTLAVSNDAGEMVNTYWYTPFGEKVLETGSLDNRFTFIGAFNVIDEHNGYYLMGKRLYDPVNGRFMQRDPKGMVDGTNMYAYALNNPLVHIDPAGTDVANGTANLYTCEGPVYGDDFFSEETAEVLAEGADLATDLMPVVGDVKAGAKVAYNVYKGDYKQAAVEGMGLGLGKYVGGKFLPKLTKKFGSKAINMVGGYAIDQVSNKVVQEAGNGVTDYINNPPSAPGGAKDALGAIIRPPVSGGAR